MMLFFWYELNLGDFYAFWLEIEDANANVLIGILLKLQQEIDTFWHIYRQNKYFSELRTLFNIINIFFFNNNKCYNCGKVTFLTWRWP